MATKFETKQAITPLVQKISPSRLRLVGVFVGGLLNDVRQILPRPTPIAMATKFETKLAITRLVQEISPTCLRLNWGFRGRAVEWCQSNFTTTDPGCHGNEIWYKTGYNSARIENIAVPLATSRGYSWVGYDGYRMMSDKFYHDHPSCHGDEI